MRYISEQRSWTRTTCLWISGPSTVLLYLHRHPKTIFLGDCRFEPNPSKSRHRKPHSDHRLRYPLLRKPDDSFPRRHFRPSDLLQRAESQQLSSAVSMRTATFQDLNFAHFRMIDGKHVIHSIWLWFSIFRTNKWMNEIEWSLKGYHLLEMLPDV